MVKDEKKIVRIKLWIQRNGHGMVDKGLYIVCVWQGNCEYKSFISASCWTGCNLCILFSPIYLNFSFIINADYLLVWVCLLIFWKYILFYSFFIVFFPLSVSPSLSPSSVCIFIVFGVFIFFFSLWSLHSVYFSLSLFKFLVVLFENRYLIFTRISSPLRLCC